MIQGAQSALGSMGIQKITITDLQDAQSSPSIADKFSGAMEKAIKATDTEIQHANEMSEALAAGENVGLHETMIAVERADVALRTFVAVKNRVVEAYQEVMRMQV